MVFSLIKAEQKANPRKQSIPWLCSRVLTPNRRISVSCNAFLMLVTGEGRQAHNVTGAAVSLWESKQQAVFTVCCLQSLPPSLLSGC